MQGLFSFRNNQRVLHQLGYTFSRTELNAPIKISIFKNVCLILSIFVRTAPLKIWEMKNLIAVLHRQP